MLDWFGDRVAARTIAAVEDAAVETVDATLEGARRDTPVLTGDARDSLHREGPANDLRYGYGVPYGIWIEIGANGRAGEHALRRNADTELAHLVPRARRRLGGV